MYLPRTLICCFLAGHIQSATATARQTATPESSRTDQTITASTTACVTDEHLLLNRRTALPATNLVLTTTFTPSPRCLSDIYVYAISAGRPDATLGPLGTSGCLPESWRPDPTARFSPGVCPSGYTVACSTAETIGDLSETTATCCPSGYTCFYEGLLIYGEACSSAIVALTTISAQAFIEDTFVPTAWVAGPYCSGGGDSVNAHGVVILWQSTDFYGISPPPATTTELVSPAPTASCIPTTTSNEPVPTETNTPGWATSDKISIGVGLGVGIPSLLFTIFGVLYTRKSYQLKMDKREAEDGPATARATQLENLSARTITRKDERGELIEVIREVAGQNKDPPTEGESFPTMAVKS